MSIVIKFEQAGATDISIVGGKASSLGRLVALGFKVPAGFTLSTAAHGEFLHSGELARSIHELLAGLDTSDAAGLEVRTARIRALIEAAEIPVTIATAIRAAYEALGHDINVAVRSSGTAEDLAQASFAGMYDTYLDVRGAGRRV
jgi:pyruvate,water dikinase